LEWVSNFKFDNVDFALDSKRVVDCVNSHIDDSSEFGCNIYACKQPLLTGLGVLSAPYTRQQLVQGYIV